VDLAFPSSSSPVIPLGLTGVVVSTNILSSAPSYLTPAKAMIRMIRRFASRFACIFEKENFNHKGNASRQQERCFKAAGLENANFILRFFPTLRGIHAELKLSAMTTLQRAGRSMDFHAAGRIPGR